MRRLALVLASIAIHLGACGTPDGRLIVLVESDLPDLVHVEVSTARLAGGGLDTRGFAIGSPPVATTFPFSFAVEPNGHPDDGVEIIVAGYDRDPSGATPVVSRTVRTGFVPGSTRLVRVSLTRSCRNVLCDGGTTTCELGTCQPIPLVPANGLPVVAHPGAEFEDAGMDAAIRDGGVDAPGLDAPGTDAPGTDAPGTDAPGTDAPGMDAPGTDSGIDAGAGIDAGMEADAYVVPMTPMLLQTLTGGSGELFGSAVALDDDGSVALVGGATGVVRLYVASSGMLGMTHTFRAASIGGVNAVALARAPGAPCIVRLGAPNLSGNSIVYSSDCTSDALTPRVMRTGPDTTLFGSAVAVRADGLFVVGAPESSTGDVRTYDGTGTLVSTVAGPTTSGARFGYSVALSDDGRVGLASAPSGGALVRFDFSTSTGDTSYPISALSGYSVAIDGTGTRAVFSGVDSSGLLDQVYVLRWNGSAWTPEATLDVPVVGMGATNLQVAMDAAGARVLVGRAGVSEGGAWVFVRTGTSWSTATVVRTDTSENLGISVALSGDGHRALVGASIPAVDGHAYSYAL